MKERNDGCWIPTQYAVLSIITLTLVGLWIADFVVILIISILFWLYIPVLIIAVISFFQSLRFNTKHKKILMGLHLFNITLFAFLWFYPGNKCDADIMETHYLKYSKRMDELYRSVYDRLPLETGIEIEFEHGGVSMFHVADTTGVWSCHWDPSEEQTDSLLQQSGLDRKFLSDLKRRLKDIDCISIEIKANPDSPYTIGFRRIDMGKYSYRIYRKPLSPDAQKEIQEDDYTSIVFSPYVVFEYGGGAIGVQNFIGKEAYLNKKKRRNEPDR